MLLLGLAIFKYAIYDWVASFHYLNWDGLDYIVYAVAILVYIFFFTLLAVWFTNLVFDKFVRKIKKDVKQTDA